MVTALSMCVCCMYTGIGLHIAIMKSQANTVYKYTCTRLGMRVEAKKLFPRQRQLECIVLKYYAGCRKLRARKRFHSGILSIFVHNATVLSGFARIHVDLGLNIKN